MPRKESIKQGREEELPEVESGAETSANGVSTPESAEKEEHRSNGGWREIEAMREKAALKASLADVWDEDFIVHHQPSGAVEGFRLRWRSSWN